MGVARYAHAFCGRGSGHACVRGAILSPVKRRLPRFPAASVDPRAAHDASVACEKLEVGFATIASVFVKSDRQDDSSAILEALQRVEAELAEIKMRLP